MRDVLLLARLEARRTAPLAACAFVFGATWLAARYGGAGEVEPVLAGLVGLDQGASVARGTARVAGATLGLVLATAAVVVHAAGLATRWRRGDGDWLGARPIGQARALAASALGVALGAVMLVAAVALGTALSGAPGGRPLVWRGGPEEHTVLAAGSSFHVAFDAVQLGPGSALRVRIQNTALDTPYGDARLLVVAGSAPPVHSADGHSADGPSADGSSADGSSAGGSSADGSSAGGRAAGGRAAERAGAAPPQLLREHTLRIARRGYLEVELGDAARAVDGHDKVEVLVTALGPGTLAIVGPSPIELYGPAEAAWRVDLALGTRALALVLAAAALALAFGAWVAPPLASLLVVAAFAAALGLAPEVSPAVAGSVSRWWPGAGLGAALELAGAGHAPSGAPPGHAAGLAALVLGAGLVARGALGSWRHAP